MGRVRRRIGDKRVLALVKAFLKAGIFSETTGRQDTHTGTPQGGILSPLLSNIALSVLDDFAWDAWQGTMSTPYIRTRRRRVGQPNWQLVRYADDFVILVHSDRHDAEQLRHEVATVLSEMGLRLSPEKTALVTIDEGFDFLGFRIQRHRKQGTRKSYVYTYPSRKAIAAIKDKVRGLTHSSAQADLTALLQRVNGVLRGWANYFKHGVSKRTFSYLGAFTWRRVANWLRKRHKGLTWTTLRRRFMGGGWRIIDGQLTLFNPATTAVTRYRRRHVIPSPWTPARDASPQRHEPVESRMLGDGHVRFGRAARGNGPAAMPAPRPGPTPLGSTRAAGGVHPPRAGDVVGRSPRGWRGGSDAAVPCFGRGGSRDHRREADQHR